MENNTWPTLVIIYSNGHSIVVRKQIIFTHQHINQSSINEMMNVYVRHIQSNELVYIKQIVMIRFLFNFLLKDFL